MKHTKSHQPKKATPEDVFAYLQKTKEKTDFLIDTDFSAAFQVALLKLPMLSANEKLVYIVLKSYASQDGSIFPSAKRIGMDASLSPRAVQRAIDGLSDPDRLFGMPLVTVKPRFDGDKQISNEYTLHSPKPILQKILGQATLLPKKEQFIGDKLDLPPVTETGAPLSHRQAPPVRESGCSKRSFSKRSIS